MGSGGLGSDWPITMARAANAVIVITRETKRQESEEDTLKGSAGSTVCNCFQKGSYAAVVCLDCLRWLTGPRSGGLKSADHSFIRAANTLQRFLQRGRFSSVNSTVHTIRNIWLREGFSRRILIRRSLNLETLVLGTRKEAYPQFPGSVMKVAVALALRF